MSEDYFKGYYDGIAYMKNVCIKIFDKKLLEINEEKEIIKKEVE